MIITRYLAREIGRPFLTIVGLLGVVFTSYSVAVVLEDAAAGFIPTGTVMQYVVYKWVIAMEVLVPISLYLGVIVGLGRWHSDSEMTALAACGIGEGRVLGLVLRLSILVALLVAVLSLVARPWAYQQRYELRTIAETEFEIADIEGKRFYVSPDSEYVIHAHAVDQDARRARTVFFQIRKDDKLRIILADQLYQPPRGLTDPVTLIFSRGHAYQLDRHGTRDMSLTYKRLTVRLAGPEARVTGYKSKTESTLGLRRSDNPKDLAEFQWRVSTPLATVLLAVLAVPLSRAPPRQGRYGRTLVALLAYAVFHTLMAMAKNLVQEGIVGPMPGLWWPLGLVSLAIAWLTLWPRGRFRLRRQTQLPHSAPRTP